MADFIERRADPRGRRSRRAWALLAAGWLACAGAGSPAIAPPTSLRPCCAFGHDLGLSLGGVPLVGVRMNNVIELEDLGEHKYDGGLVTLDGDVDHGFVSVENNGLLYTCRGGFIDTAHVRDYADWTFFLWREIVRREGRGGRIALPDEGGRRVVYVVSLAPDFRSDDDRHEAAVALAQYIAFQISVWHEIVTWYGWSASPAFSERASAFSPEDLYSNRLGVEIAGEILRDHRDPDPRAFNRRMDEALPRAVATLGAVPGHVTRDAVAAIDVAANGPGGWWDSSRLLPAPELVLRRNLDLADPIAPWTIPESRRSPALAEELGVHCADVDPEPSRLAAPDRFDGKQLSDWIRLDVKPAADLDPGFPGKPPGAETRWLSQRDFPLLVAETRRQILATYGPDADRP